MNLFELYLKAYLDSLAQDPSEANLMVQFTKILRAHNRFEKISKAFPFPGELDETEGRVFQFDGLGIKNILGAMKMFDPTNTVLPDDEATLIGEVWQDTEKLLKESEQHLFTIDDIRNLKKK